MSTIILCNRTHQVDRALRSINGDFRFIDLLDSKSGHETCSNLRSRPGAKELDQNQYFRERSQLFFKDYVRFMGQLNKTHYALDWWVMPFTNKNPLATTLCWETASFLLVADLADSSTVPLVVVAESSNLVAQIRQWAKGNNAKVINLVKTPNTLYRLLKGYTPGGLVRSFSRTFLIWLLTRRYRLPENHMERHLLIATLTHPQSFSQDNQYKDSYFGTLIDKADATGYRTIVLALVLERPFHQLNRLKLLSTGISVVPIEASLSGFSLTLCALRSLWLWVQPVRLKGSTKINGRDVSVLLRNASIEARHSGENFLNLRVYYATKNLARKLQISRCLYPYENRSWEKMLLMGIRRSSPDTRVTGYQHASITPSHSNFFLGKGEAQITPLPDLILTTGEFTKNWLEEKGNYPTGMLQPGCALRQQQQSEPVAVATRSVRRILVTLATNVQEYNDVLGFLFEAFDQVDGYEIRVRPHPAIPMKSALATAALPNTNFFSVSAGTLDEDLKWAGVVVYVSSTVGLEAINRGIPVVHLDVGGFMNSDPMSEWDQLRWNLSNPSEMIPLLAKIDAIPDVQFDRLQRGAREYAESYLTPVTEDALRTFWES